jgi:hypothetical protein
MAAARVSQTLERSFPLSVNLALRRAPFLIFAKTAPLTLPNVDVERDFPFYFVNDMMTKWSGLSPDHLVAGRNAKSSFPLDYDRYFQDDIAVCELYHHPLVKEIIEPWQPPMAETYMHVRKTAVHHEHAQWVLACAAPFDEIELGISGFRASRLTDALHPLSNVPDGWYDLAWTELPQATFAVSNMESKEMIAPNGFALLAAKQSELEMAQWARDAGCPWDGDEECTADAGPRPLEMLIMHCLERIRTMPDAQAWEFGGVRFCDSLVRVWAWRPLDCSPTIAFSFRPHLDTIPDVVRKRFIERGKQNQASWE